MPSAKVIFLESIVSDDKIVERNIRAVKLGNPDWKGFDPENAVTEFQKGIGYFDSLCPSDLRGLQQILQCCSTLVTSIVAKYNI